MTQSVKFDTEKDMEFKKKSEELIDSLLCKAFETRIETPSHWLPTDFIRNQISVDGKQVFKSKNDAYQFLNSKVEEAIENFFTRISEFNPNDLLQFILHLETTISILTNARLDGKFRWEKLQIETFTSFNQSDALVKLNTENPSVDEVADLKLFYHNFINVLGKIKKSIDVITNSVIVVLKKNNLQSSKNIDVQSMIELMSESYALWEFNHFFKLVSKEKEEQFDENTIFIEDGKIIYPNLKESYIKSSLNNMLQDYDPQLDDETEKELQNLYFSELGFNLYVLMSSFKGFGLRVPRVVTKEDLRSYFSHHAKEKEEIGLKGLMNLLNMDILLEYKDKEDKKKFIFSDEHKISIKGILKIDEQYLLSLGTIFHYNLKLVSKMTNPSFTSNKKISKFIKDKVSEFQIDKISKYLTEEGIWNKINVTGFDNLLSEASKEQGTTKEIDLLLYNTVSEEIIFVEYKSFLKKSFDRYREIQDEQKMNTFDQSHIKLLDDLKLKQLEFIEKYSIPAKVGCKFTLMNVFEDRNILCGTESFQGDYKIIYKSRVEFEDYLFSTFDQLAKIN
jgi:hypothetical protein